MIDQFHVGQWYTNGKQAYQVLAIEGGHLLVQLQGKSEPTRFTITLQSKIAEPIAGPPKETVPTTPAGHSRRKGKKASSADTYFSNSETAPLIADIIYAHGRTSADFITHAEIVAKILADPKGSQLVRAAAERGMDGAPALIAGNMLDHFSKDITIKVSPYTNSFERQKLDGGWAYKPYRSP